MESTTDQLEITDIEESSGQLSCYNTVHGNNAVNRRNKELLDHAEGSKLKSAAKISPPPTRKSTKKRVFLFFLLVVLNLLVNIAISLIGPFFPREALAKGVTGLSVGFIAGSSSLCIAVCSPIFGYFLPELGVRFTLLSGTLLVGGAHSLLGFSPEFPSKIVFIVLSIAARIVQGIGIAASATTALTIVTALFPSSMGTSMGILEVAAGLGFAIGPLVGGALESLGGFKLAFLLTGGMILLYIPILYITLPSIEAEKGQFLPFKTVVKLTANIPFIATVLSNTVCAAGIGFFVPIFATFVEKDLKLTTMQMCLLFSIGPVFYIVSSLVAGKLTDILGARYLMCAGLILVDISFLLIGPAPFISDHSVLWMTIFSFCLAGVGLAAGMVPAISGILELAKFTTTDQHLVNAMVSGLLTATRSIGEFIGPIIGGGLSDAFGFSMSSLLFAEIVISETLLLSGITIVDLVFKKLKGR